MDNLLSETNHVLSILDRAMFPSGEEIQSMTDAELTVLNKNLSTIVDNMDFIEESVEKSERHLQYANHNLKELKESLETTISFKVGLLDIIFSLNAENLKNLPKRLQDFRKVFQRLRIAVERVKEIVVEEHQNRKVVFLKKRQKMLWTYPMAAVFSVVFATLAIQFVSIPFVVAAIFPQLVYWGIYLIRRRKFHKLNKYPSWAFKKIQVSIFALTQALHKYVATGDILTPTETKIKKKTIEMRGTS